jgi:cytoplasmic iron level regulating protein YaaA (DUF328/UPF0246 family)
MHKERMADIPFFITLSPAKKFAAQKPAFALDKNWVTVPSFLDDADALAAKMRTLSAAELSDIMKISADLASLNHTRYQNYRPHHTQADNLALYSFAGDAYMSLEAPSLAQEAVLLAQQHLGILSGLYGLLRPLDTMQYYRLEMGRKPFPPATLYQVWRPKLRDYLNQHIQTHGLTYHLSLASQEYAEAINQSELVVPTIRPNFLVAKNNQAPKVVGIMAKRARGAFVRYVLTAKPQSMEALQAFHWDGFVYHPRLSGPNTPHFVKAV